MKKFEGTKGKWSLPHMADAETSCNCAFVLSSGYCGAIATIHSSEDRSIENGDNPPIHEAIANAKLIAAAPTLLNACLALTECYETKGQLLSFDVDIVRQAIKKALL